MRHWWCMGCQAEVKLDKHGRCETCESEAVDLLYTDEVSGAVSAAQDNTLQISVVA
jgi:Zn finger protein HypA/HybF involved in hydrogenase expression